ncbi:MAG: hypothetical protein KDA31_09540 [Phycisphaerales bacterium]|nr:hypothetical protein [Phycisphaerales bacterium]MCB9836446.1 hypothetical protein [Phycisphaera sp.]
MGSLDDHISAGAIARSDDDFELQTDALEEVLSGQLPCWVCGYELSGLSVTGVCPECGTPVRTTLLAVVDPSAASYAPLRMPRIASAGLVLWTGAALLAILTIWLCRLTDALQVWFAVPSKLGFLGALVPVFAALSGLGGLVLIHPQKGDSLKQTLGPILASALYVPLVWMLWYTHAKIDLTAGIPYFTNALREADRVELRCAIGIVSMLIALLVRPSVRAFAKRSVLMRTGQLTRQTLLAVVAALAIALAGDMIHVATIRVEPLQHVVTSTISLLLVAAGSALVTVGFAGMFWDAIRLYPIIRNGPRSLGDVVQLDEPDA